MSLDQAGSHSHNAPQPVPENVVVLDQPIVRGATTIAQIALRKPNAGALRGITLSDLLQMDVNAIVRVIPRISTPTLTEAEVRAMDPADLVDAGSVVASFLLKKSMKADLFPAT
ncbi:phage tail assembly protein [Pseudomonas sp. BaP3]|nr:MULTISPECIES: phage tail assembly protein [Pseudomonas]MDC7831621.1 phage tail assembly protein [Pseudomonas benzopyrenica]QNR00370.1 phage tail protein [Pseudomonas psychrotolerans]